MDHEIVSDREFVTTKLREGYELRNRGNAWLLSKRRKGQSATFVKHFEVPESLLNALVESRVITVETLSVSLMARLVQQ
jgi:hypothetical protein